MLYVVIGVACYFLLVFVGLRLIVPNMEFGPRQKPVEIPQEIREKIAELEDLSHDQLSYAKNACDFVLSRWSSTRAQAILEFTKLFRSDIRKIWNQPGYAHCVTQNHILYVLLVHSKFFCDEDIQVKHVFLNFVPHQYLRVKVGTTWIDIDPAAISSGMTTFGRHAHLFG